MFSLDIDLGYITRKEWWKNHSRIMDDEDRTYHLWYWARCIPFFPPFKDSMAANIMKLKSIKNANIIIHDSSMTTAKVHGIR